MGDSGITYLIASAAENSIKPPVIHTPSQISQYLHHISLPLKFANSNPDLQLLAALQRHHLASIPFENLALHYSPPPRTVSLDPQAVYDKFIVRHRGGYCMEQNLFFAHMLRGLGFTVYSAGARVRRRKHGIPVGDYMGWSHVVSIVTIGSDLSASGESQQYMVDVGFGGDGPTKPISLIDGSVTHNLGTQEVKLKYENIDSNVDLTQKLWVYKVRNHGMDVWKDCYCFTTLEFLPQDYAVMSYYVNNSPQSWLTTTVVAVRIVLDHEQREDHKQVSNEEQPEDVVVVGKEMLSGAELKRNMGGRTQLVKTCTTEQERVDVLRDIFGLVLTEEERMGITGSVAALPLL